MTSCECPELILKPSFKKEMQTETSDNTDKKSQTEFSDLTLGVQQELYRTAYSVNPISSNSLSLPFLSHT